MGETTVQWLLNILNGTVRDVIAYQVELLLNHYIQAVLAILLATAIFIYCRKSKVKGETVEFQLFNLKICTNQISWYFFFDSFSL